MNFEFMTDKEIIEKSKPCVLQVNFITNCKVNVNT